MTRYIRRRYRELMLKPPYEERTKYEISEINGRSLCVFSDVGWADEEVEANVNKVLNALNDEGGCEKPEQCEAAALCDGTLAGCMQNRNQHNDPDFGY